MNKQNRLQEIEQEVAKTLGNLENLPKLEAKPFFASRVKAKIKHAPKKSKLNLQSQPVLLRVAMITLLVGLNLTVFFQVWSSQTTQAYTNYQVASFNDFLWEYQLNTSKEDGYSNFQ